MVMGFSCQGKLLTYLHFLVIPYSELSLHSKDLLMFQMKMEIQI